MFLTEWLLQVHLQHENGMYHMSRHICAGQVFRHVTRYVYDVCVYAHVILICADYILYTVCIHVLIHVQSFKLVVLSFLSYSKQHCSEIPRRVMTVMSQMRHSSGANVKINWVIGIRPLCVSIVSQHTS